MKCDLHIHSDMSDGIFSPETLVDMARQRGLECISVTDHDGFEGTRRARKHAAEVGLRYVVGAELSTVWKGADIHILAYNVDVDDPALEEAMQRSRELREARNRAIYDKLAAAGMPVDPARIAEHGFVGRPVIAREMVRLGYCKDVAEAFDLYLAAGKSCYVQSVRLTPEEAIRLTLRFGGLPVLAHPKQLHMTHRQTESLVREFVACGLAGIEGNYFAHNTEERIYYNRLARKYRLISTGGSDFHDHTHGTELGKQHFSPNGYTRKVLGV